MKSDNTWKDFPVCLPTHCVLLFKIFILEFSHLLFLSCLYSEKWKRSSLSCVWLFAIPWACQAPLSTGILQARILEWVAISFSRGSFWPRNPGLLHCRQILCRLSYKGSPLASIQFSSAQMFSITTEYLVQHFYFHLSVSPNLNCFSCKPSEVRSWFLFLLIQSDYLGFLIRVFVPFKCNVIVDMTGLSLPLCNTFLLPPFLFLPSLFTFLSGEVWLF